MQASSKKMSYSLTIGLILKKYSQSKHDNKSYVDETVLPSPTGSDILGNGNESYVDETVFPSPTSSDILGSKEKQADSFVDETTLIISDISEIFDDSKDVIEKLKSECDEYKEKVMSLEAKIENILADRMKISKEKAILKVNMTQLQKRHQQSNKEKALLKREVNELQRKIIKINKERALLKLQLRKEKK
jgi:DNA repair exonuclease SbcCD ATPase subunit